MLTSQPKSIAATAVPMNRPTVPTASDPFCTSGPRGPATSTYNRNPVASMTRRTEDRTAPGRTCRHEVSAVGPAR
ncbi:MAG: hypothetical protein JWR62_2084 [Modestobacter sp.]|jgi:hypothetical protein|nr:hypothetical protein [Modestobacter sp.]